MVYYENFKIIFRIILVNVLFLAGLCLWATGYVDKFLFGDVLYITPVALPMDKSYDSRDDIAAIKN